MKHEADHGGDAYDVARRMLGAGGLFMALLPIGLLVSFLYVAIFG